PIGGFSGTVGQAACCRTDALDLTNQRLTGLLCLSGETLQRRDLPPLHHDRLEDLLVVLQEVVEPGIGNGLSMTLEAGDAGTRHFELADLTLDCGHDERRSDLESS